MRVRAETRAAYLLTLALSACHAALGLPEGTQVSCRSNSECPLGYVCRTAEQRCAAVTGNSAPTLALGTVERAVGGVQVPAVIYDQEDDAVDLHAEFDAGAGFAPASLSPTRVTDTALGARLTLQWDAAADVRTAYREGVILRVTPTDA